MEQTLDIEKPTRKIYKDNAIWVGTFLGGPLVAGYLIAENFKAFNDAGKAKKTWLYAIIATIVIFGGAFLIQDKAKIPNQIIPIIYTAIAYYFVRHFQGQNITNHINSGGELFGWWRAIGIGAIGLVIMIGPIFAFALLSDSLENASTSTKTYGIAKHEIAFDKNNLTDREVDKLAEGLTKTSFFDEATRKFVFAKKVSDNYEVSISVVDGIANDTQALQPFIALRTDLQSLFPNNKIILRLVVDSLDNVVKRLE